MSSAMTHPVDQTSTRVRPRANTNEPREPLTNLCCVVCSAENELRCSVIPRADVRDVWLVFNEDLGTAEVAKLQNARGGIEEQILRFNISVTDTL